MTLLLFNFFMVAPHRIFYFIKNNFLIKFSVAKISFINGKKIRNHLNYDNLCNIFQDKTEHVIF